MVQVQFFTVAVGALCVALFAVPSLMGKGGVVQQALCFSPTRVVNHFQVYRAFTAPFIHAGFFHILMNMIAWYFLSNGYEGKVGSLASFYNVFVLLIPLCAVLHGGVAYGLDMLPMFHFLSECAVGISGILFALLVISLEFSEVVSVFGLFNMPSKWFPPLLAVLLQLLSPGLSLLGHLSGIVIGHVYVAGVFNFAKLSNATLSSIENKLSLRSLPHWVSASSSGAYYGIGQSSTRPTSDRGGFSESIASMRGNVSGLFSSNPSEPKTPTATAFSGSGHVVGGNRPGWGSSRTGVPPQSRLLTAETVKKTETILNVPETSDNDEIKVDETGTNDGDTSQNVV